MLTDQSITEILREWSFWSAPPSTGLARQLMLPERLHHDIALMIPSNLI
jgi:hypothetical protein